ncbi:hypothetical protein EMIHUDRAFT_204549 [Emiliania huxleyi CCMP1516]|uniref:TOG domain-containing protein n=2 Tax=Emiliania huxleyi TaxID=2903 RepID=A0A0D3JVW3_EMIH1|nr:hypothetical protein EMIHUDRAFT_204549 [Emiliania huxleyi CCMP1516]EOD27648.1 hypothetical protein EMIHUDRAFT_204549 [Emiliania huxleyi CCMP1516]|eukprot:XP_005780077.1 hypothetical protein EMIHUDRAFT_204549 [Emiliania huxleyi CCMP1516]
MSTPGANTALLEKLEKAELRIGLCEDSKLAKLLDPALPNIIGFLATDDAAVRAKVMAILTHLNKRIRGDSSVALPLTPLAKQFANPATAPMASNFCLVYLEMGLGRAAPAQRAVVVPPLLRGIARRGAAQQETLLSLLLGSLSELPLPGSHAELEGRLPFLTDPADRALVLEWLLDLLQFLPPPAAPAADRSAEPPPGLSADAAKRVKGRLSHEEVRGELLAAKKLAACRLLGAPAGGAPVPVASSDAPAVTAAGGPATAAGSPSAGGEGPLFSPLETLPHWLVASCDGDGAVKTTGEARLRAVAAGTDLESHALIDSLCSLAVSHLCRSVAAASRFPGVLQATFHALFAGDATPRLQQQGAALAEHISSHAALPLLDAAGAHLLAGLLRVTRGEATPGLRPDAPEAVSMRSHAYGALAALCRRAPKLLAADSALPTELFGALRTEEAGARTPLHEALAALAKARLAAMAWAATVFSRDDVPTRLVCLAGAADERPEGAEGSLSERSTERGRLSSLSAGWPPFAEVVRAILGRVALTRLDHAAGGVWEVPLLDPGSAEAEGGEGPPPLPTQATGEALRYALDCLRAEAVALLPGEPPETAVGSRLAVMLRASDAAGGVPGVGAGARELMALLGRSLFAHHGDRELLAAAATSLHTLVTGAVDAASKVQVAEAAALGALPRRVAEAEEPLKNVALSSSFASDSTQRLLCEALAAGAKALPRARATALLRSVVGMLPSLDAGCSGPSEAKRAVGASLLAGFLTARLDPAASSVSADAMEEEMTKHSVVAHLASLLRREKVRTTAVRALGQLVAGDPHAPFRNAALLAILGMHTVKDVELQLVVGDALATLAMSPPRQASSAPPPALPRIKPPEAPAVTGTGADATLAERTADAATACELAAGDTLLRYVLGRVLLQHVVAWAPLERQAGAAWLLALLRQAAKSGGGELAVRTAAGRIQAALVGLLADSNEATQELASKGLSALFDCCDEASRATILQELVAGLQSSRAANASASGGEMATYKELSEIATSVGQPALVYKLMECAASSAVWNTRKGVAFALAEQSRDALEPHLPSLLPTLFRYTFDPNPRVANAMRQLWAALVPDPKPALTKHLQPVLEHLCASLGDRLWRGRESACLALAELLPGRTLAELSPTLARLLTALLRVLDDVKETVRKAAEPAWRAVSSACVRLSDGGRASASDAEAVLEIALPILLDGVRAVCTKQLLKLVQGSGKHSLSSNESSALTYMQQHAPGLGVSAGTFEAARVAAARASPAHAALEQCLAIMDDAQVGATVPRLSEILVRGTGLPARCGAARVVLQLARDRQSALTPHAGKLLSVATRAILEERSAAARRAYASAAAQLARLAKPEPLGDLLRSLTQRYVLTAVTTNEQEERLTLASLVRELGRGAPDAMGGLRADWLPLAFIGRHEPRWEAERQEAGKQHEAGALASVWEEAYDEGGGNAGAAASHLQELLALLRTMVDGQSWALRRAAAAALIDLANLSSGALKKRPDAASQFELLAASLRESSRRWDDKEALLPKLNACFPPPPTPHAAPPPTESADM